MSITKGGLEVTCSIVYYVCAAAYYIRSAHNAKHQEYAENGKKRKNQTREESGIWSLWLSFVFPYFLLDSSRRSRQPPLCTPSEINKWPLPLPCPCGRTLGLPYLDGAVLGARGHAAPVGRPVQRVHLVVVPRQRLLRLGPAGGLFVWYKREIEATRQTLAHLDQHHFNLSITHVPAQQHEGPEVATLLCRSQIDKTTAKDFGMGQRWKRSRAGGFGTHRKGGPGASTWMDGIGMGYFRILCLLS